MVLKSEAYVVLLLDTLKKKNEILQSLLTQTKEQQKVLSEETLDQELFDITLNKKSDDIKKLNELDEGFDLVFRHVETELKENPAKYKEMVMQMQDFIAQITEKSMQLQALESKNSDAFKRYLVKEKEQICNAKLSSQTVSNYYKNMSGTVYGEESHFFNQKK